MTELSLEISRHLPHPPERVFDAWLDPKMLSKFMIPGAGVSVPEATSDAKVGGRFRILMRVPGAGDLPHEGTYQTIDRATKLAFTWESHNSMENSVVTLDLAPKDGGTDLTLRHVRFPSEQSRDDHQGGWTSIIAKLEETLA
ncbi:SRPBCC family protein [Aliiroseovarius lamellibrachiae]|uniref:SRPBCC family protein n=1 Tax=Aliiroseovarius lamellibrachiae TaxID=1924933 RepID=UPI001BE07088|nr:SRPBCC domain-containing protein [Aliiroseovarius lamellibrachiae]MBT2132599.1 SRPBCC domain-containing protein [Aliiroseovarius lamellibrachiae]